jgi:DedD protein
VDQNTKQRLVGIAVIFALAVIFLPMILDGSGVRKNTLEVVIPPQPVVKNNPEFEQKIVELHAKVEDLPSLESQFVDERSSENANQIERKTEQKDSGSKSEPVQSQPASKQPTQPEAEVTRVGGDTWVLQVGSYKDRKKALSQRDKLRKSNIAAVFIEKFSIDNELVYRVRLGPFLNRDQSKVALNKIKAKYDIDGLIMKYHK